MGLAYSEIPKLKNNVFAERGSRLHNIAIIASGLSEIEDQALNSLKLLESLILSQNKLRVVKSVWFKDTPLLDTLILKKNQISHVDKDIGRFLPNLQTLDLEENHLTCLHSDVLSGLPKIQRLYFIYANPITDKCRQQSIQVFENMMANNRNVTFLKGYLENVVNGIDYTKECLKNLSSSAADESIKNCMNSKGDEALKEVLKTVGHWVTVFIIINIINVVIVLWVLNKIVVW